MSFCFYWFSLLLLLLYGGAFFICFLGLLLLLLWQLSNYHRWWRWRRRRIIKSEKVADDEEEEQEEERKEDDRKDCFTKIGFILGYRKLINITKITIKFALSQTFFFFLSLFYDRVKKVIRKLLIILATIRVTLGFKQ